MVRTFLVFLRASTAIAVQICADFLSLGFQLCSSAREAAKTRHAFEKRSKRYFLYLAKSGAALWTAISVCRRKS